MNQTCLNEVSPEKRYNFWGQNSLLHGSIPIPYVFEEETGWPRFNFSEQNYSNAISSTYRIILTGDSVIQWPNTNVEEAVKPFPKTIAPLWLRERMEILQQMPPPTLQKVRAQLRASAETRKKLTAKPPA